mmetsp:Transcript_83450/g.269928  ORF Transcript_83450/g.269928 Transcript_83450/m.269928 type:complete len:749 (-) Transcript_83450:34-2280(-)
MAHQNVDLDLLFHSHKERKFNNKDQQKADEQVVNCLRCLAMDAVQEANSGHPGTPMAMAPVAYALWARLLHYDPQEPQWMNRDRFVLSMGHASMLIYGLLHLAGVKDIGPDGRPCTPDNGVAANGHKATPGLAVSLDDIKNFRQHHSRCPGHPEYRWTAGVETTTGPLGQGVANSVGMAIASKWYAATFNKPNFEMFSYNVYALCGDGCLMEGVAHEAASLAGHLKLDNLCWIWDNNQITIEGNTSWAISEDIATRFIAYGWNVLRVGDANDVDALARAMNVFKREKQRPTFIVVDSHIAWGAPTKQDSFTAHGAPLGKEEVSTTKGIYGWPDESFLVPETVLSHFRGQLEQRGGIERKKWDELLANYAKEYPSEASTLQHIKHDTLPEGWDRFCKDFPADAKGLATRQSSAQCLNMVAQGIPWMLGGSADLAPSCLTTLTFEGAGDFMAPSSGWGSFSGRNFHFGIREHAMGSIMNGLAVSKLRPFGSTFLVFSDYMKPPIRLSSIMEVPSIFIFTHDSIGVGEDGPTHQPIEHLVALRSIPGLMTFRPCDANEVLHMWKFVGTRVDDPIAIVLSRQPLPTLDRTKYASAEGVLKGAYVIAGAGVEPQVILMATGSEVSLMLEAHHALEKEGVKVRSVSMPCLELFKQQTLEYMQSVLPDSCRARVSIEAATSEPWGVFTGLDGEHVGMITFGSSAPIKKLHQDFGFTVEAVVAAARRVISKRPRTLDSYTEVQMRWKKQRSSESLR